MKDTQFKLRHTGSIELRSKINKAVEDVILNADYKDIPFQTCIMCMHFNENEICAKYNVRPPARIIVFGCQFFENDPDFDIPF